MYLTSEESRNSLSDESIYSVTTTDLISFKEEVSSPENNVSIKNQTRPKRKREKLDHLSNEEKLMRRKLKNRISAQTARDRKRQVFVGLQEQLAALSQERVQMQKENELLRKRNLRLEASVRRLEAENGELRGRLSSGDEASVASSSGFVTDASGSTPIESAEFISVCQQNKQGDCPLSAGANRLNRALLAICLRMLQMIFLVSSSLRTTGPPRRATLSSGASRCCSTRRSSAPIKSWLTTSSTNCTSAAPAPPPTSCPPTTAACLTVYLTACLRAHWLASHKQRIRQLEMMKFLAQSIPTI